MRTKQTTSKGWRKEEAKLTEEGWSEKPFTRANEKTAQKVTRRIVSFLSRAKQKRASSVFASGELK
jgi:hypothetical protein